MEDMTVLVVILGILAVLVFNAVFTIRQQHIGLVTRFGKYARSYQPGLNALIPFIERLDAQISLQLRRVEDRIEIKTSDDVVPEIPVQLFYRVRDAEKYHFNIEGDKNMQILNRINAAVRKVTSGLELEELYSKREEVNAMVQDAVREEMEQYGIIVSDVIVDEPLLPDAIKTSYNNVRAADRNLLAAQKDAEAEKVKIVKEAEARREAAVLYGQGIAEQRAAIISELRQQIDQLTDGKTGLSQAAAVALVTLSSEQDTLREIGGEGNLIIASGDTNDMLARLAAVQAKLNKDN